MDRNWVTIATWMKEYADRLVRTVAVMVCDEEDAQDIVQEVFVKAYNSLDNFRNEASPFTYLYAIALNLVRSHKRKLKRSKDLIEYDDMVVPGPYLNPEDAAVSQEQVSAVVKAVGILPHKLREVVSLFYVTGISIQEISDVLDVSIGTVKSRLFRAREKLKRYLSKEAGYGSI
ncbi:MAG: RNA polymerase sigma factor [Sphaerochaetaceae bacterium]|jgi:RNA polymerase sigma-70 factor (ECF subfamily)|nr:RNA polymerase sigma factor [Sphaerochaetaceae bacterium]MDD2405687.1 RNA polymerase sigma factor [Sphaerochaetaceae bacterium]MDD4260373.1 RNA polymerase sigma factor [Sphaerochaetaceae bacterium]NLO60534.1 RNA polymerase sigma factor [Spirochaetales bacterium]